MNPAYAKFIQLAIKENPRDGSDFLRLKKNLSKVLRIGVPSNPDLREAYEKLVSEKKIKRSQNLENCLKSKNIRSASGVAVVAVLTKPYPCPGKCIYCPDELDMPKSYLFNEPAVMRAIDARFNPFTQVRNRLRALELNGHPIDKIEIIVMGGTFSYLPKAYQEKFITECFRACNEYKKNNPPPLPRGKIKEGLIKEQKRNETAKVRIVGLTLETRPDYISEEEIINFRRLGATRVELGVQSVFDSVLEKNKRGHSIQETIRATKLLRDAGFKINYHIMPGLLGSSPKSDFEMFQKLFSGGDFQPDMLKIYPTVVTKNTALHKLWKEKKYRPLSDKNFEELVLKIKKEVIPPYVRIQRLVRDVPLSEIIAGPKISNLRQMIASESQCQCIRCREIGQDYVKKEKIFLNRIDYKASDGQEIFLQFVSIPPLLGKERVGVRSEKLYALLRLRIPSSKDSFIPTLQNAAIIREVHTYGQLVSFEKTSHKSPQHLGMGKKLLKVAEKIAKKEFGLSKIAVISGVGVRGYYRKNGYRLKDTYMLKSL